MSTPLTKSIMPPEKTEHVPAAYASKVAIEMKVKLCRRKEWGYKQKKGSQTFGECRTRREWLQRALYPWEDPWVPLGQGEMMTGKRKEVKESEGRRNERKKRDRCEMRFLGSFDRWDVPWVPLDQGGKTGGTERGKERERGRGKRQIQAEKKRQQLRRNKKRGHRLSAAQSTAGPWFSHARSFIFLFFFFHVV